MEIAAISRICHSNVPTFDKFWLTLYYNKCHNFNGKNANSEIKKKIIIKKTLFSSQKLLTISIVMLVTMEKGAV